MECVRLAAAFLIVHTAAMEEPIVPKFIGPQSGSVPVRDLTSVRPTKDWPHAPVHRLSENGVYIVTAGTLHKQHCFDSPGKRDLLEGLILSRAKICAWDIEAWAVFSNHYHFVARGNPGSSPLQEFVRALHSLSARELNQFDKTPGRVVWHNFWDTRLTYQYSYLARLRYVHENAVKHGLVIVANQYPWCSAAWFERVASPAQVKTIYGFKTDKVNVIDDF
jgi:putative transposase